MIATSGSTFSKCFNCPLTCATSEDCNHCTTKIGKVEYLPIPHIYTPSSKETNKMMKEAQKKNWKAIQDKHSRR